jgi:hypothetical protein
LWEAAVAPPPPPHKPSSLPSAGMESDPPAKAPLVCAECGRAPRDDENAADEWRAYAGVDDELHVFCKECPAAEFG